MVFFVRFDGVYGIQYGFSTGALVLKMGSGLIRHCGRMLLLPTGTTPLAHGHNVGA